MKLKNIIVGIVIFYSMNASASFQCTVSVDKVLIYKDGIVNILHPGRGDYTHICNLSEERQGVSVTTCAMWTSMLQNIKKNDGVAQFYYTGDGSCSSLPTYSATPAPLYIGDF